MYTLIEKQVSKNVLSYYLIGKIREGEIFIAKTL